VARPCNQKEVKIGGIDSSCSKSSSGPKVDGAAGYKIYWESTLPHLLGIHSRYVGIKALLA